MLYVIGALIFGLLLAVSVLIIKELRKRNRKIWEELFKIREINRAQKIAQIELFKLLVQNRVTEYRLESGFHSQHGEDAVLWSLFDFKLDGTFVEIGAHDGKSLSNSYFFESIGWHGVLVEPEPKNFALCCRNRPFSKCINAAVVAGTQKKSVLLKRIKDQPMLSYVSTSSNHKRRVERTGSAVDEIEVKAVDFQQLIPKNFGAIDFISIDTEGNEFEILRTIDFEKYSPLALVVEENMKAVDNRIETYLKKQGYKEIIRLGCNCIYVSSSFKGDGASVSFLDFK
jgi:FkbM family methyltransferase